jgi:hypothetical protein
MTLIANVDSPSVDLCVGLLNDEVPAGIHVVPVMPPFSSIQKEQLQELKAADLGLSQAGTRPGVGFHESVVYPGNAYQPFGTPPAPRLAWAYGPHEGDSGTPRFYVTSQGLALYLLTGADSVSDNIAHINSLIAACDASAVTRGVLEEPTGEEITVADISIPNP